MPNLFRVENQLHELVRQFSDAPGNHFLRLCARRRGSTCGVMWFIEPYDDAMVNRTQQQVLLTEIDELLAGGGLLDEERTAAMRVRAATEEAYEIGGFLFVLGE